MTQKTFKVDWKASVVRQKLGKKRYWAQRLNGQHAKPAKLQYSMVWEFPPAAPLCAPSPKAKGIKLDLSKITGVSSTPDVPFASAEASRHVHFEAGLKEERETTAPATRCMSSEEWSTEKHVISRSESLPARFHEFNSIVGSFRSWMETPVKSGGGSNNTTPREDRFVDRTYTPRDANPQASPPKAPHSPPAPAFPSSLAFSTRPEVPMYTTEVPSLLQPKQLRKPDGVAEMVSDMEEEEMRTVMEGMLRAWERAEATFRSGELHTTEEEDDDARNEEEERWCEEDDDERNKEEERWCEEDDDERNKEEERWCEEDDDERNKEEERWCGGGLKSHLLTDWRRMSLESDFNPVERLRRELGVLSDDVKRTRSDGAMLDPALQAHCLQLQRMVGALQGVVDDHHETLEGKEAALKTVAAALEEERRAKRLLEAQVRLIEQKLQAGLAKRENRLEEPAPFTPRTQARIMELWLM